MGCHIRRSQEEENLGFVASKVGLSAGKYGEETTLIIKERDREERSSEKGKRKGQGAKKRSRLG